MTAKAEDFIEQAAPYRAELIAHCYRMLGSVHDAEDLVQETYLRGWRGYGDFEERAALRTWLYRIATNACLRALENRARRVLPAGLGEATLDPETDLHGAAGEHLWLEPLPDLRTPESAYTASESVRLAIATALQELPARQRAVLILRDVVQFSATEVAEALGTTPTAVHSALARARARLAEVAPNEDDAVALDDAAAQKLLDRYCAAFENGDVAALTALLCADVSLEMPPHDVWFTGAIAVARFLSTRAFGRPGAGEMIATAANGQPAVADYRRDADGVLRAHAIHVLTVSADGIRAITVFLDPRLFDRFRLPSERI